jgi:Rad52/22 family double-strand break repair protein
MALTNTQVRQLRAKLDPRYVKTRQANGTNLHYVEGWHVIAEANRIFGCRLGPKNARKPLRVERTERSLPCRSIHRESARERARR